MYVCHLTDVDFGSTCVHCVELIHLSRQTKKFMFQFIKELLERLGFDLLKLVSIAAD